MIMLHVNRTLQLHYRNPLQIELELYTDTRRGVYNIYAIRLPPTFIYMATWRRKILSSRLTILFIILYQLSSGAISGVLSGRRGRSVRAPVRGAMPKPPPPQEIRGKKERNE